MLVRVAHRVWNLFPYCRAHWFELLAYACSCVVPTILTPSKLSLPEQIAGAIVVNICRGLQYCVLYWTRGHDSFFFFFSFTEAPIVFQFSILQDILVCEKTASGRGIFAWHGGPLVTYIVHIVNNAALKPISLTAACHWRRNNDHSHFLFGSRWQIALCCESRINWPIDLYPLLCLGFHFYVPWSSSRRWYFTFLYRPSTPLVDGFYDKSNERADYYRFRLNNTYIYILIADINNHPLEWRTGRKLFWFDEATIRSY